MTARVGYHIPRKKCKVDTMALYRGHAKADYAAMHRDTDELPAIMAELEEDVHSIQEAQ